MSEPEAEPELFLILHKVRTKPAYDIAYQMMIGDELGWLIPTSGHRAYPITKLRLRTLTPEQFTMMQGEIAYDFGNPWHNLPDHFTTSRARASSLASEASDLLSSLGLHAKRILRRI